MQVIALTGAAKAGKNTVQDYLVQMYGFIRYAFSDPLYEEVRNAFDLSKARWNELVLMKEVPAGELRADNCNDKDYVEILKRLGVPSITLSPRFVLESYGTEYRRSQSKDYWLDKADLFMEAYVANLKHTDKETSIVQYRNHPGVVVDGMRFENERAWVEKYSGQVWHILRPDAGPINGVPNHESTKPVSVYTGDKIIMNNGTVSQLHGGVGIALSGNDVVNSAAQDWFL